MYGNGAKKGMMMKPKKPLIKKKPKKKRGRYLPESVRKTLTKSQKAATNRKKRKATASGRPKAKYSKAVARKVRRAK